MKKNSGCKKARHQLRKLGETSSNGKFTEDQAISVLSDIGCPDPKSMFKKLREEGWILRSNNMFYIN